MIIVMAFIVQEVDTGIGLKPGQRFHWFGQQDSRIAEGKDESITL